METSAGRGNFRSNTSWGLDHEGGFPITPQQLFLETDRWRGSPTFGQLAGHIRYVVLMNIQLYIQHLCLHIQPTSRKKWILDIRNTLDRWSLVDFTYCIVMVDMLIFIRLEEHFSSTPRQISKASIFYAQSPFAITSYFPLFPRQHWLNVIHTCCTGNAHLVMSHASPMTRNILWTTTWKNKIRPCIIMALVHCFLQKV